MNAATEAAHAARERIHAYVQKYPGQQCVKACVKCDEVKPVTEFYRSASAADRLDYRCKVCRKASGAKWRAENPEKVRAAVDTWHAANREKVRAYRSARYAENPEKGRAVTAAYFAANTERARAASLAWKKANPEKIAAYRAAKREEYRLYHLNRRARKAGAGGRLSKDITERLYKLQRGKCACCGKPLGKNFHRDHIMPIALGGTNTDDNIQLLRQRCNNQKHVKHPIEFMQQRGFLL